ncbi:hypothetical protein SLEP1_g25882 [Rubroshorea leprosula]|uniref:Uncharacterized protein n=1 Tax=Rubroshorea leprosula TaxID=152421 RepID=A0AAV5JSI5_9ROSI|nr:hypothetical protein SLEP1_g25882 [Rubroshorea leprosula]
MDCGAYSVPTMDLAYQVATSGILIGVIILFLGKP